MADLQRHMDIGSHALGYVTSSVQLGFIAGTLGFAILAVADRFSPRMVFFLCCLCGAIANSLIGLLAKSLWPLLILRFLTGFFLAGVYPVGMKVAAGWYREGLGRAMGWLVGALVLGTAFPHMVKGIGLNLPWKGVVFLVSGIALVGGFVMLAMVPDGPYNKKGMRFSAGAFLVVFQSKPLRSVIFSYFGHMWELYAFLAFIPVILSHYLSLNPGHALNIPLWSFGIIAAGTIGCVGGGLASRKTGPAAVAFSQLAASCACCLFSPFLYHLSPGIFLAIMLIWGATVSGDSPQFSTLIAKLAPAESVGSALTIVTCIGFSITIISIQLLDECTNFISPTYLFLILSIGPVLGLRSLLPILLDKSRIHLEKQAAAIYEESDSLN